MKGIFLETYRISLTGLVVTCLASCQGSNLGSSLEGAIAPSSPSANTASPDPNPEKFSKPAATPTITKIAPEAIAPTPSPSPLPTIIPSTSNPSDRLLTQVTGISLSALPKKSNISQSSLKTILLINFDNPPTQVVEFSDIEQVPASLRPWIRDLNKLGTITAKTDRQFQPNLLVARREYARWLLQTNNRLYRNQPSRQIRLAQPNDLASFPDIPNNHPDFAVIQGLANAGLINGTGDRFRPNDPLLREELVLWKIPLDLRQPLPSGTWDNIAQTWGFKDSDRISENALGAIFADAQLRDLSNIRRSFGFTTILQPQKPVTRAEAAASLWYFGTAIDGISASKVLESN